jgi:DNA-binding transcriptional MerR regulator
MLSAKSAAVFNVKAVVHETGLKPDTLRAWERRYGLPQPERTGGGQRLYSQRDIEILKWLIARQGDGLSISHAVSLWRELAAQGQEPLPPGTVALPERFNHKHELTALRASWVSHCLAFKEREAEQVLNQALALYPLEAVCAEILQEGVNEIDDRWYLGAATIQQLYFASELVVRRVEGLLASTPVPPTPGAPARRRASGRVLVACPPQEGHTLGALLLSLFLRQQGRDVLYLGANLPLEDLEQTLAEIQPDLVVLSAQQLSTAATLLQIAYVVTDVGIPFAYGGRVFNLLPSLRAYIPGQFISGTLSEAPRAIDWLLTERPPWSTAERVPTEYQQALDHYLARQPLIEAQVRQAMDAKRPLIPYEHIAQANNYLTRNIAAALTFGDMSLLDQEITWLEGLFSNHHVPVNTLYRYLNIYYVAAKTHLLESGRPIVAWLAHITGL